MRLLAATAVSLGLSLSLGLGLALPAGAIEIEAVETPNGHTAWLVEDHSIPFVSIEVIFAGGASLDPVEAPGATALMTYLLEEGAGELDAQAFATRLESLAGEIGFDVGRDSVSVSIRALSENRAQVIDLAISALTNPAFDAPSIERVRGQMLASLERDQSNPNDLAQRSFTAAGYAGHPYATPTEGTLDSVAALTRAQVVAAHRAALTRDRAYIAAAGDITAAELAALVERLLIQLPAASVPLPEYRQFSAEPGVTVVPLPGSQSVIQFGHAGMHWDDPDFMPAFLMNHIFGGGGFGSRLMTEIREERGLTYGIYTYLASNRHGDSYVGRFSTANETVAEAIALVRAQFEWLADGGITQDDLDRVQTYLTGAYPLRFDGNGSIARVLASMQFQGYDIDYVNIRNDLVRAVTLADLHRVSARLAQPDALVFVVVGEPVGIDTAE